MSYRAVWAGLAAVVLTGLCLPVRGNADEPAREPQPSVSDLALEVEALRTLFYFKVTPDQLRFLQKKAADTAAKSNGHKGKASKEYREVLEELHEALVDATDEDRIDSLEDRLDQLREKDEPELEDDITVTDAARKQVPVLLRHLKPSQVANYLGAVADDVADPLDQVMAALEEVRHWKANEWKDKRDELAESVGRLVGGLETERAQRVHEAVAELLAQTREATDAEFTAQKPALERKAKEIVGELTATEVLGHTVEQVLAELLSNPRLAAALEARLK